MAPCHGDVEKTALVFNSAVKSRLILDAILRDQVPDAAPADAGGWKPIPQKCGDKDSRPLHSLCLVNGHDPHGVGVGVLVILPSLWVGILSVMFQKSSKRLVFVLRFGMEVNLLEVGDQLAEFPKVVKNDFGAINSISAIGHDLLPKFRIFKKVEVLALQRVEPPAFLVGAFEVAFGLLQLVNREIQLEGFYAKIGTAPRISQDIPVGPIPIHHEVEDQIGRLGLPECQTGGSSQ